jgi:hypothetical protein
MKSTKTLLKFKIKMNSSKKCLALAHVKQFRIKMETKVKKGNFSANLVKKLEV